jgi:hypothetical protein
MWESQDAAPQQQKQQQQPQQPCTVSSISSGVSGTPGHTVQTRASSKDLQRTAAATGDAHGGAASCSAQDASWEQDAANTAAAAVVVLEELERDIQLQV